MKLEEKHLLAYAPYGLDMSVIKSYSISDGFWVMKDNGASLNIRYLDVQLTHCKPILRPMLDMKKEYISKYEVNFIDHIYNSSWMAGGYVLSETDYGYILTSKEDESILNISTIKPSTNMWWVTQEMLKWNFDVFGLIPEGLAVDINTL